MARLKKRRPAAGNGDQASTEGLLPSAARRYIVDFFFQWEHYENGQIAMHVYPGGLVNGQPVLAGEPVVLVFSADGFAGLEADVKRGGRSSPVRVATELPR